MPFIDQTETIEFVAHRFDDISDLLLIMTGNSTTALFMAPSHTAIVFY